MWIADLGNEYRNYERDLNTANKIKNEFNKYWKEQEEENENATTLVDYDKDIIDSSVIDNEIEKQIKFYENEDLYEEPGLFQSYIINPINRVRTLYNLRKEAEEENKIKAFDAEIERNRNNPYTPKEYNEFQKRYDIYNPSEKNKINQNIKEEQFEQHPYIEDLEVPIDYPYSSTRVRNKNNNNGKSSKIKEIKGEPIIEMYNEKPKKHNI